MLLPLLRRRRSIRQFQQRPVETDKVRLLMEALLRAPSSGGAIPGSLSLSRTRPG